MSLVCRLTTKSRRSGMSVWRRSCGRRRKKESGCYWRKAFINPATSKPDWDITLANLEQLFEILKRNNGQHAKVAEIPPHELCQAESILHFMFWMRNNNRTRLA